MQQRYTTDNCKPGKEYQFTNITIASTVKKLIRQRQHMLDNGIVCAAAASQYRAIEKLNNHLEFIKGKHTEAFCHMVVFYENELLLLAPSQNSCRKYLRQHILKMIEVSKTIVKK